MDIDSLPDWYSNEPLLALKSIKTNHFLKDTCALLRYTLHASLPCTIVYWKHGNMEIWKYGNMEMWKYGNVER
jgi:hypothetical protein